ncbi:hypothetical protein P3342_007545 [Pyrenophora teres f. teres]|nr:hypothetical protein P3342_007545 [Pyrenophora teres f. teres]
MPMPMPIPIRKPDTHEDAMSTASFAQLPVDRSILQHYATAHEDAMIMPSSSHRPLPSPSSNGPLPPPSSTDVVQGFELLELILDERFLADCQILGKEQGASDDVETRYYESPALQLASI